MLNYRNLIEGRQQCLHEIKQPYHCITERHVQAVWLEQKYLRPLSSLDGRSIHIESPGIWNLEAGPDFLKAHLVIDGSEVKGDVEIHLYEEDWVQHNHHQDPRYNDVAVHIFLWKSRQTEAARKQNGDGFIAICLEPFFTIPLARIVQLLDLEVYPYKKFVGSGRCAQTLFRHLHLDQVKELFRKAALWRLEAKRSYLQAAADSAEEALQTGIALALGYKHNAKQFLYILQKAGRLNLSGGNLLALMMGWCGFFLERYSRKWEGSLKYENLKQHYETLGRPEEGCIQLTLHQIRPLNHPIRRLAALANILSEKNSSYAKMAIYWKSHYDDYSPKKLRDGLMKILPSPQDSYWESHYLFEQEARVNPIPLLGRDIKQTILMNSFLPLLQEEVLARGIPNEIQALENFLFHFPSEGNSKTKYLTHRFFGDTKKGEILENGGMEQGAYQIHKDFCIHYEASCDGCPFIDRFLQCK